MAEISLKKLTALHGRKRHRFVIVSGKHGNGRRNYQFVIIVPGVFMGDV